MCNNYVNLFVRGLTNIYLKNCIFYYVFLVDSLYDGINGIIAFLLLDKFYLTYYLLIFGGYILGLNTSFTNYPINYAF